MPRLLIPLIIVSLGVMIYALIEAISTPSDRTRIMPKGIWIVVIILVPLVGGVLWLLFGNENSYLASTVQGFKKTSGPPRPRTPDDDEEFLRSLIFNATRNAVQKSSSAASVNCVVVNKSSTTIQTRIRIPRKSGAMGSTG